MVCSAELLLAICQVYASLIDLWRDWWETNLAVAWVGCANKGGCHASCLASVAGGRAQVCDGAEKLS